MARKLENYLPPLKEDGLVTDKNATLGGTLAVTGTSNFTGAVTLPASTSLTTPVIGAATGTSLTVTGNLKSYNATAIPAGGTTGSGYLFSSTSNFGIFFGSGVPTLSAATGSLYLRSDAAASTRLYVNTNGLNTWTSFNAIA